jgi:hypothetical protein
MDVDEDGRADLPRSDVVQSSDGDFEFGVGGGFFPASHHGAAFEVFDDSSIPNTYTAKVGFTVVTDDDGDGLLQPNECREDFIRLGVTSCPAGGDGGWWVILRPRIQIGGAVSDPPTTGIIVSGPLSQGSQKVATANLASARLIYMYDTQTSSGDFTYSSPGGWDCNLVYKHWGFSYGDIKVHCQPPTNMNWSCHNWNVYMNGAGGPGKSDLHGEMDCSGLAKCGFTLDYNNKFDSCDDLVTASAPGIFDCKMEITNNLQDVGAATLECFNDP